MKTIFKVLILLLLPFFVNAQDDLAILSLAVEKYEVTNDGPKFQTDFQEYIINKGLAKEVSSGIGDDVAAAMKEVFALKDPLSYTDKPEYKFLLDDYEPAPENLTYDLATVIDNGFRNWEGTKSDYKLSEHQVYFVEPFLAVSDMRPYNNIDAIKKSAGIIGDVKGLALITVSLGNDLMQYNSKFRCAINIIVLDSKGDKILTKTFNGTADSSLKINSAENYDDDVIKSSLEEAVNNCLSKVKEKLPKSVAKMKW